MCKAVLFVVLLLGFFHSPAQQVNVKGTFRSDSIMIGKPVAFSLTASYPRDLQIVFPDSTYDFTPFELESKEYFTTSTPDTLSYDSVVYYLTSYEVDSLQFMRLPVFVSHPGDCTEVWSPIDTIYFNHLVAAVPDTVSAQQLPLRTFTEYLPVDWLLNYPVLLIVVAAVLVAGILVWIIFGKRIKRYYRVKRLQRNHYSFLEKYEHALQQLRTGFSAIRAETALVIWKKYMESLEGKPYTKFTSREIAMLAADQDLAAALKGIDRIVYGGLGNEPGQAFLELQHYSESHFAKKLEEITHG